MLRTNDITLLLTSAREGNRAAIDALLPLVYDRLRTLARAQLASERAGHTLSATALVHESYLNLVGQTRMSWENRAHFFAIAAQAMRRILIDYARRRMAKKRGGDSPFVTFDDSLIGGDQRAEEVVALDAALVKLRDLSERQSQVVEFRFFGGLTHEEIAAVLKVSVPTVRRDWRIAKAWLANELR
jgi:RNA polymerase sigma factor (TIGR02999 family)